MSNFSQAQFLAQQDLINERPPQQWLEGLPLGNGDLGVVAWGGCQEWRLTLDKIDLWHFGEADSDDFPGVDFPDLLWNGSEENWQEAWKTLLERHPVTPTKLAAGRLTLELVDMPPDLCFAERLILHHAMAIRSLSSGDRSLRLELWVQATRPVVCVRLPPQNLARQLHLSLAPPGPREDGRTVAEALGLPAPERGAAGTTAWLRQTLPDGLEAVVAYALVQGRRLDLPGPEVRLELKGRPATWLYLTIATAKSSREQNALTVAQATLEEAVAAGMETLEYEHRSWWYDFWSRSFVSLADRRMENLWYVELYKLASTSRAGHLPAGLQGVWSPDNGENPGRGGYFHPLHTALTYWPAYTANHLELAQPLTDWLYALWPRWQESTRQAGGPGMVLPPAADPQGRWLPAALANPFWCGAGAWMAHHFWLHWRYSQDRDFLRDRAYPFLKACSAFWEAWMGSKGPATPQEVSTLDRCLSRFLGEALAEASAILEVDAAEREQWQGLRERFYPYSQLQHLAPLFPFGDLNLDGAPEEVASAYALLEQIITQGYGQWPGWSFPWAACAAARLGWRNFAVHLLDLYLDAFIQPNTFHVNIDHQRKGISNFPAGMRSGTGAIFGFEKLPFAFPSPSTPPTTPPFTLEAGFAAATAVNEMLLQSWGGKIRLFPALPQEWDASFRDLRAEGAFQVSAVQEGGQVRYLAIRSLAGGTCRVVNPWLDGGVRLSGGKGEGRSLDVSGKVLVFETEPGEEYCIENDRHSDPRIRPGPVARRRGESGQHPFGLRVL